jgi:hypothetical protein
VVKEKRSQEILCRALEKSAAAREQPRPEDQPPQEELAGSLAYLRFYPSAWTEICDEVDDETREEYEELVDE